jgi:hypothetical protein
MSRKHSDDTGSADCPVRHADASTIDGAEQRKLRPVWTVDVRWFTDQDP